MKLMKLCDKINNHNFASVTFFTELKGGYPLGRGIFGIADTAVQKSTIPQFVASP